jgi:Uma2 family endonuclease
MAEAGVFAPDDRVELFDGEVLELAPIGSRHAACVKRTAAVFAAGVAGRAIVSVQDPMELDARSEPQPDLALLRPQPDFYAGSHPQAADVLLAVEVAETTLRYDLNRKAPRYLAAGIPGVWVVDVVRQVVHVLTPDNARVLARGDSVAPQAFPDLVVEVTAIVG